MEAITARERRGAKDLAEISTALVQTKKTAWKIAAEVAVAECAA